ncbi:uncharacterized protein, partial [Amphiura filiformis]|uniref:uncharacterized protein n=1 Tax=Amphiura filiformis TaxID=82378 RepID=UPI003B21FC58
MLLPLEKDDKIKKADKQFLYPTSENVPRIYGSPKIHKDGTPLRPIVDFTGSIGYNVAKSLADILSPIVGQSEHHVLNSRSLAEDLKDVTLEEDEILNSHDVVALFTSTPIDLTLHILRERLNEDKDLKNRTLLSTDDIIELTKFCLATVAYFSYSGQIYRQCFGMAMGIPLSPLACNIFMEWLEQKAISTAPDSCRPRLWKRYVDDVLEIIRRGQVDNLTDHLNSIQFSSHHPLHQKLGVVRTLLDRSESLVTEETDRQKEETNIREALSGCGYPDWSKKKSNKIEPLQKQRLPQRIKMTVKSLK